MTSSDPGIEQAAAHWAVRASHGELDGEQQAALDLWLARDRRHRGAYLRARAGLKILDRALTAEPPRQSHVNDNDKPGWRDAGLFRRLRGQGGAGGAVLMAGLALCLLLVIPAGLPSIMPVRAPAMPDAAETMKLADGSVVTLRDGGRIQVSMSDQTRRIVLLSGEASFKVAKDQARPFVVQSGSVYAQATGTRYSVRRQGESGGAIAVAEGSVLVWARDEREQAVLLRAGDKLALEPTLAPQRTVAAERPLPPPAIAKISLDDVPIASAVARFNRINSTQIVIADPAIGDLRIVGLFRANDPEGFAEAVAQFADAEVAHEKGRIVIKMKS
ncbi:DUF4880 domain-containing protein [Sandaracinobacter neustonicus]|uniref:DUF4880 domain-containing protein n=1 Tax=Sandaracinobacter neustonicus TaxID=1715348 RepID=A0A501XSJ2_9SPHN|nr:FecR domain-containing protein [Sandaracinobacter neustonicus]TPE63722.1 DUF4880 domain-containing protein [Sandaracinobacter neustonicus]